MIIALEPLIPLLPDKGGVVSSLQGALMIYHGKERVSIFND